MNRPIPSKKQKAKNIRTLELPNPAEENTRNHADNYWTLRNKLIRLSIIISGISIFVSATSVLLAVIALNSSIDNQRDMKGIDLLATFQKRYDELAYDARSVVHRKSEIDKSTNSNSGMPGIDNSESENSERAKEWYHRFWDLQFEQYQYWELGYINIDIYASWMDLRRHEWETNDPLAGIKYQDGWKDTKEDHFGGNKKQGVYYTKFIRFMENVFNGRTEVYVSGPLKQ